MLDWNFSNTLSIFQEILFLALAYMQWLTMHATDASGVNCFFAPFIPYPALESVAGIEPAK